MYSEYLVLFNINKENTLQIPIPALGKKAEKRAAASGCTFGAAGYGCPFVIKTV